MNPGIIVIRNATSDDEEAAAKLADDVYSALRKIYRPTAKAQSSGAQLQPKLDRLVAVEGDQIVGTVKYVIDGSTLRVIGLAVAEDARGSGVARQLITALSDIARSHGATTLSAYTVLAAGAVPFYERLGFHVVKECEEGYFESPEGVPMPEVLLELAVAV